MANVANYSSSTEVPFIESLKGFDPAEYAFLINISSLLGATYIGSLTSDLTPERLVTLVVLPPLGILSFFTNLTVLAAFWVERKQLLRVHFNIYIVILSCLDFFLATVDIPIVVVSLYYYFFWPKATIACSVVIFINDHIIYLSVSTVVAISIDRYSAACWSTRYRSHNTQNRTILLLLLIWIVVIVVLLPPYLMKRIHPLPFYCDDGGTIGMTTVHRKYDMFKAFMLHVPFVIMACCSGMVYRKFRKSSRISSQALTLTEHPDMELCATAASSSVDTIQTTVTKPAKTSKAEIDNSSKGHRLKLNAVSPPAQSDVNGTYLETDETETTATGSISNRQHTTMIAPVVKKEKKSKEIKILKSLIYLVFSHLLLWTPFNIFFDMLVAGYPITFYSYLFCTWPGYFSGAINPFMYALGSEKIRLAIGTLYSEVHIVMKLGRPRHVNHDDSAS